MFAKFRWSSLIAWALVVTVAAPSLADDTFVQDGVIVKPLPKWKQRKLEKKLLKNPGNKVVIEGNPSATPSPEALAGLKSRRAFRPLFGDRFGRRNDVVVAPSVIGSARTVVTTPGTVVSTPRTVIAPGDSMVMPGSVEMMPTPKVVRPPVISTPRGQTSPVEPIDEPELEPERPASARILPPPADEIPPPVVSIPRKPAAPAPMPLPAPARPTTPDSVPPVDPGPPPSPVTPPPAPEPEPTLEPTLERPIGPKPA